MMFWTGLVVGFALGALGATYAVMKAISHEKNLPILETKVFMPMIRQAYSEIVREELLLDRSRRE